MNERKNSVKSYVFMLLKNFTIFVFMILFLYNTLYFKWEGFIVLTVKELLSLPQMNEAKLIAGEHGCNRIIKWTHITDHEEVGYFLEGGE